MTFHVDNCINLFGKPKMKSNHTKPIKTQNQSGIKTPKNLIKTITKF